MDFFWLKRVDLIDQGMKRIEEGAYIMICPLMQD